MKKLIRGFLILTISIIFIMCENQSIKKSISTKEKSTNKNNVKNCFSEKDSLEIKNKFIKIFSSKRVLNNYLFSENNIDTELINSVLKGNSKIKKIYFTDMIKVQCLNIKIEVYTSELFKDDDEEHLIERTILIEFIQKNKTLKVFDISLLAG